MYSSDSSFSNASSLESEASSTPEPQASLHEDFYFPSQPLDILGVNFDEAWYEAGQALYRIIQRIAEIEEQVYSSSSSVHTLSNALADTSYELSTMYQSQPELHGSLPTSDTEEVSMRNFTQAEKIPDISPNDSISRGNDSMFSRNLQPISLPLQGQTRVLWHSSLKAIAPVDEKEIISSTPLLCIRCKRSMDTEEKLPFKRSKSL